MERIADETRGDALSHCWLVAQTPIPEDVRMYTSLARAVEAARPELSSIGCPCYVAPNVNVRPLRWYQVDTLAHLVEAVDVWMGSRHETEVGAGSGESNGY